MSKEKDPEWYKLYGGISPEIQDKTAQLLLELKELHKDNAATLMPIIECINKLYPAKSVLLNLNLLTYRDGDR